MKLIIKNYSSVIDLPITIMSANPQIFYKGSHKFINKIIHLHKKEIQESLKKDVSFLVTDEMFVFGLANIKGTQVVIGPTTLYKFAQTDLQHQALALSLKQEENNVFFNFIDNLPNYSITKLSEITCFLFNLFSDKKNSPEDIIVNDNMKLLYKENINKIFNELNYHETPLTEEVKHQHNYDTEQLLFSYIRRGDIENLKNHLFKTKFKSDYSVADTHMRNLKNITIVSITLATRAAIEGGLKPAVAFELSDVYIRKVESMTNVTAINNLMIKVLLDFTDRVGTVNISSEAPLLIVNTCRHIKKNIYDTLTLQDIADNFSVTPSYLSALFKKHTGITLILYIQKEKINEAKRLLKDTTKSILEISLYLGFSSQSYFQNIFKKHVGMTPYTYRTSN